MNERGNIDERIKRCFTSSTVEIDYLRFYCRLSIVTSLFRACRISQCLTTGRRQLRDLSARARMTPSFNNAYAKRPDRLAETSEWGPNFPWTARLIICPWDTRSIMAAGIASYPFYAK